MVSLEKSTLIEILSKKIKLIRTEFNYSQDYMSEILGISKKTLVQIEKGRIEASWSVTVTLCALFRDSEIVQNTLGGDPLDILQIVAHQSYDTPKELTLGGKIWWTEIHRLGSFRLQKNLVSDHYRILDESNRRWFSTFDENEAKIKLEELNQNKE